MVPGSGALLGIKHCQDFIPTPPNHLRADLERFGKVPGLRPPPQRCGGNLEKVLQLLAGHVHRHCIASGLNGVQPTAIQFMGVDVSSKFPGRLCAR